MQFNGDAHYQCSPEAFVEISTTPGFVAERIGPLLKDPVIENPQQSAVSAWGLINPEVVPAKVRSLVANKARVEYDEVWTQVAPGEFRAKCTLAVKGLPVSAEFNQTVTAVSGDLNQCQWHVDGDYHVLIPLIGRSAENTIFEHLEQAFERDRRIVNNWLIGHAGEYPIAQ